VTSRAPDGRLLIFRRRRRRPASAAAVALCGLLAACGAYEYATDLVSAPIVLPCPKSWVIADAASLVQFRQGDRRDLTDIDYEGEITGIRLGCTTDIDKKTRAGTMDVEVEVLFNATRGPANHDRKALFRYFVSVTDTDRNILYREAFDLAVAFPGNRIRLEARSGKITLQLPIAPNRISQSYLIFTGYELTREQLEFNRARGIKTGN
jgi:hypothetical protein